MIEKRTVSYKSGFNEIQNKKKECSGKKPEHSQSYYHAVKNLLIAP